MCAWVAVKVSGHYFDPMVLMPDVNFFLGKEQQESRAKWLTRKQEDQKNWGLFQHPMLMLSWTRQCRYMKHGLKFINFHVFEQNVVEVVGEYSSSNK